MRDVQAARGTALTAPRPALSGGHPASPGIRWIAIGIGLAGLALDQSTKILALTHLEPGVPVDVIGSLVRFILIRNPGAAFGLGSGSTLVLSLFAILALLASLVVGLPRIRRASHAVALGLLMAGISGNLYDRLFREPSPLFGHVVDFIALPYFAIFNVADICVTSAAALIVLLGFRHRPEDERAGVTA